MYRGRGREQDRRVEGYVWWDIDHGNARIHEEPREPSTNGDIMSQWDTLVFKGEHAESAHWWLVENRNRQVGHAPAAFLVVILATTAEEEESDATVVGR